MENELLKKNSRSEWVNIINEWVLGRNAQRDRDILIRCVVDGSITYERIAEEYAIEKRQVDRIVKKRINELVPHVKF
jgi:hypothetical protein